ncbi:hypothetical protein BC628DRAFT_564273 [Trametes gibbosa]|nr:hypothetical protein BC628DRAFT_564273 [Trametes gibbosa]
MSPLPSLPPEIFLSIKDSIPSSDLRTHVCFYRTSTSIAQLYDSIDHSDDIWARACWACGLTRPTGRTSERPHTAWRDFVIDAIERCGLCKNNHCDEARLERSRECSVYARTATASLWRHADLQQGGRCATSRRPSTLGR